VARTVCSFFTPCTRQISSPESSSRTKLISLLQLELQQRRVDSLFHQACRFLLLRLLLLLFLFLLLLFFLSWHTIPPRVSIADTLPTFRQLLLLNAVVDPIDQEELLLLAETELVQGGEEQLWELFLPLSSLLPVLLELLQQHSHLAS